MVAAYPLPPFSPSTPRPPQTIPAFQSHTDKARDAALILCLEGIKVIDRATNKVAMAHALGRISMCTIEAESALFGFVAKNPGGEVKFCHVFKVRKARQTGGSRGRTK